jgi:acyl-coenzyme A synthetase/AMP-(fatty) acid ligase
MPVLDRIVSATAPLTLELAKRCESLWGTRVYEVYGCTETGMVATRRTVDGALWTTMRDVKIEPNGEGFLCVRRPRPAGTLADRLRLIDASTFELEGAPMTSSTSEASAHRCRDSTVCCCRSTAWSTV